MKEESSEERNIIFSLFIYLFLIFSLYRMFSALPDFYRI